MQIDGGAAITVLVIFGVVLLIGRELTTWYFKINELLKVLREISAKLGPTPEQPRQDKH